MGHLQFYVGWKVDCNPMKWQHTFVPPSPPPSWKHTWLDKMPLERAWKQWSHCEGWKLRARYSWMIEKHNMLNRCKNCIIHDFLKWGMSFHSQLLNRCKRCKISSDFLCECTNYFRYAHTTCEFWLVVTGVISLCSILYLFWGILIREERLNILSLVFLLNGWEVWGEGNTQINSKQLKSRENLKGDYKPRTSHLSQWAGRKASLSQLGLWFPWVCNPA